MLRTLGKTSWEKVKIGEVYLCCDSVGEHLEYKTGREDTDASLVICSCTSNASMTCKPHKHNTIYKLPKSVQRLWITE